MHAIQRSVLAAMMSVMCAVTINGLGNVAAAADSAFKAADRNADGKIDREEFRLRQVEIFYFLDKDRDGFLVVEEITGIDAASFSAADANKDGKLSLEEFLRARSESFEAADTNSDGVISQEEYEAFEALLR